MRLSRLFIQTLREVPSDTPAHAGSGYQRLLRAGFVRTPAPGSIAWLPLGAVVRRRAEMAARRVLADLGGQELLLPAVLPVELAVDAPAGQADMTPVFPRSAGQHCAQWVLADSHAAYLLEMVRHTVQSYRQLPVLLYHLWQPLQAEVRPSRGLLGSRETRVVDAFSLHRTEADRLEMQQRVLDEYCSLLELAGLATRRFVTAGSDDGPGRTEQLVWLSPLGDLELVICETCGWAHDRALAPARRREPPPGEEPRDLQEVATPGCRTIADLCAYLDVPPARTAKALFLIATRSTGAEQFLLVVVRGDTDLSEIKLGRLLNVGAVRPATEDEIRAAGAEPGYGSPVRLSQLTVIVDHLVAASPNLVGGANRAGYHLLNINHGRDYQAKHVADIALANAGDGCPVCGGSLGLARGTVIARAGDLDDTGTQLPGATYLDDGGEPQPVAACGYRFYIDRLIAAVCELHHDEQGLVWPRWLAPCDVHLLTVGKRSSVVDAAADRLYADLMAVGLQVLYDDRDERAGVKFNDADLLGVPLRIAVGERGVTAGSVEVKHRRTGEVVAVPIDGLVDYVDALCEAGRQPGGMV